jgi:hypothetical protein
VTLMMRSLHPHRRDCAVAARFSCRVRGRAYRYSARGLWSYANLCHRGLCSYSFVFAARLDLYSFFTSDFEPEGEAEPDPDDAPFSIIVTVFASRLFFV